MKNDIIFTTPIINNKYDDILKISDSLPYKIGGFKFINPLSKSSNNLDNDRIFVHKKYKEEHLAHLK